MRSLAQADNCTLLKALFMSGSGCSDRGYSYPARFHRRILAEAGWRQINYFPAKGCIFVLGWIGDFIGGCVLISPLVEAGLEANN
jgi:hypothetical protein